MNRKLITNDYFDEMVLLTPVDYEHYQRLRQRENEDNIQRGGGPIDPETLDAGSTTYKNTNIDEDDDPRIERLKQEYLLATNDVSTVYKFTLLRRYQKNLNDHLENGKPLMKGHTVYSIARAIDDLYKKNKSQFNALLNRSKTEKSQTTYHYLKPGTRVSASSKWTPGRKTGVQPTPPSLEIVQDSGSDSSQDGTTDSSQDKSDVSSSSTDEEQDEEITLGTELKKTSRQKDQKDFFQKDQKCRGLQKFRGR